MNGLIAQLGRVTFWLTWPVFWIYLQLSERTRVLLVHGDSVLVVKGWVSSGKWSLPGGGLHRGEGKVPGALREVSEETGILLSPHQLTDQLSDTCRDSGLSFFCHYFALELANRPQTHKQRFEIRDLQWVKWNDLTSRNSGTDVLTALNEFDKYRHRT